MSAQPSAEIAEFVREHGARDVLIAVLDMAVEIYGEDRAVDKVLDLVEVLAHHRNPPAGDES